MGLNEYVGNIKPSDYSDAGNAEVFSNLLKDGLCFTDSRGWLAWDGKVWRESDHKAVSWAMELTGDMLADAKECYQGALLLMAEAKSQEGGDTETAKRTVSIASEYLAHAKQSRNERKIRAMLELSKPALHIAPEKLDANPADLNTPDGIIDLVTGEIRPHDPSAYCTRMTAVAPGYNGAETWRQFLNTITEGDGSLSGFLQLVAGMALYGKVYEEGLILAYGGGRNGKSTFLNVLASVMGDYAGEIGIDTLTTDRQDKGPLLVELRGKRLVLAGELEEGKRLSVSILKRITSTDRITAAAKYRQPETFVPSHTLILHSNYLPRVGSTDEGTWRRIKPVEFRARIPEGEGIPNYADVLLREAGPAVLNWAIQGAMNFARNGYRLDIPDIVAIAAEEYRQREDWLENFLSERCILEPETRAPAGELYAAYREWAERAGDYVRRLTDFNAAMEGRGFIKRNTHGAKTWIGLKLDYKARFTA